MKSISKQTYRDANYLIKVLSKEKKEFCKVSYILIHSTNLIKKKINKLQDQIIGEYNSGKTIIELVAKYNQDLNPTGELDWFGTKTMLREFEKAVWNEPINAVIKVNIPSRDWHYVVFKAHENVEVNVANCARVKICHTGCSAPHSLDMEIPERKIRETKAGFPGGDCEFNLSLKMDQRLLELKNENASSDTIILYRHWTGTNGERGYASFIKMDNGTYHEKDLTYTNSTSKLGESEWHVLSGTNNPISSFATIGPQASDSLAAPEFQISHNGLHTVQVFANNTLIYCDEVRELRLQENPDVSRIEFIKTLRDLYKFSAMSIGKKRKNKNR
ncbi:MAG: peptidylprolyl isomerase [Crocinitomicaceae bacterium]|nr:peptidylprolyl isomerase [Crocinitomicaceae bacterium]